MNAQDIINKFETYTGDTTELSTQDELDLANKIYRKIQNDRPWEWLKKTATGTVSGTTIAPPSDFAYFAENNQATDIAQETVNNASPKVIFISTTSGVYNPWQIVNFSDRRQFLNQQGYAWFDAGNNVITLAAAPNATDLSYEFDYIYTPPALTLTPSPTSPIFPVQFHDIIFHGMALDDMIIQLFDRTHSYQQENQAAYDDLLSQLRYWNAQLQMQ
jgi:hypothetical protein